MDEEKRTHIENSWLNPIGKWQSEGRRRMQKGNIKINV
jgi:hypothetical protein